MNFSCHILISVHSKHVENMLAGRKTVELRRRALRVLPGTQVWIYCTQPTAQVSAVATIKGVFTAAPNQIWQIYGPRSGLIRSEFDSYFEQSETGCAIVLSNIRRLKTPLSLHAIRKKAKGFHPPQFFKKLTPGCPEFSLLSQAEA